MEKNCLDLIQYLTILQRSEMKHLKQIMQPLCKNVAISIPGSIRYTIGLTNLKY